MCGSSRVQWSNQNHIFKPQLLTNTKTAHSLIQHFKALFMDKYHCYNQPFGM